MKKFKHFLFFVVLVPGLLTGLISFISQPTVPDDKILSYTVDPKVQDLQLYWKDDSAKIFRSIRNLKNWLSTRNKTLVFAMNGGMYQQDNSPQGLFIQEHKTITKLNTGNGNGNFHLKPNGVFYITNDKRGLICKTENFKDNGKIRFATQSGPMLVIDGTIHPAFKQGSSNLNIRNGVGILPDHKIIFAVSKEPINFYDFADYFKRLGCLNALYLDGFVSRTYLPEKKWIQTDGNFGVLIGVSIQN
jgi:uncharacterized protein YigE (DUF2233 family)